MSQLTAFEYKYLSLSLQLRDTSRGDAPVMAHEVALRELEKIRESGYFPVYMLAFPRLN